MQKFPRVWPYVRAGELTKIFIHLDLNIILI